MAYRFSKQRQLILDVVRANPVHPTADTVYDLLKDDYPSLSLGTVYRNLKVLSNMNQIQSIDVSLPAERFDARMDEHSHMYCKKCGRVLDIEIDIAHTMNEKLERLSCPHQVESCRVFFSGVCADCLHKR